MNKLLSVFLLMGFFTLASCNNEKKQVNTPETKNGAVQASAKDIKTHECTAACKDGNHLYIHNEIGHTCSTDCGRPHVCAGQCKNGSHVYAHGEVGHYCICPKL